MNTLTCRRVDTQQGHNGTAGKTMYGLNSPAQISTVAYAQHQTPLVSQLLFDTVQTEFLYLVLVPLYLVSPLVMFNLFRYKFWKYWLLSKARMGSQSLLHLIHCCMCPPLNQPASQWTADRALRHGHWNTEIKSSMVFFVGQMNFQN